MPITSVDRSYLWLQTERYVLATAAVYSSMAVNSASKGEEDEKRKRKGREEEEEEEEEAYGFDFPRPSPPPSTRLWSTLPSSFFFLFSSFPWDAWDESASRRPPDLSAFPSSDRIFGAWSIRET